MRQPLLSFRKKSRKQKVFVFNSCFHFRLHTVHVQWTLHDLCFFGILRCCSFLSIERNKELNKLLSQAKRKAVKMEQQLQKSKVTTGTCSCFCYFPSTEKRMIVTTSLEKLLLCVVRPKHLQSFMIDIEYQLVTDFFLSKQEEIQSVKLEAEFGQYM